MNTSPSGPSTKNPKLAPLTVQDILIRAVASYAQFSEAIDANDVNVKHAADHLYQAMQEVIGEYENAVTNTKTPSGTIPIDTKIFSRNLLRTEQRTRLNKLFGRGE